MNGLPSEEIKSRLDIHDVVSEYVRLQKQGANWRACCPFHSEKTPSFYVSPARQIWHCFGCGLGGDMFSFVMRIEGVEFSEALRILAKKAGVELKQQDKKQASERALLQEICDQAARFFQNNLAGAKGKEAVDYLKKRGFKKETVLEFRIGYAPDEWEALYNFLTLKGYKSELIEKAGLVSVSDKSGRRKYFDRFRDRVMFPLADQNGAVVGFTGRYLKEKENEGKYVNSPQTPLFNKSAYLYGLDKSKLEIRKHDLAAVVEGQMDLLMAWQDGVKNVAAASGTAFTPQQLNLLSRYTHNLCLIFDADAAGDTATQRSIALAHAAGFFVKVARIPDGKDPADFVTAHPGKLEEEIKNAVSIMDYYLQFAFEHFDPKTVEGKKKIGELLLAQIKKIKNKIETHHWLEKLSTRLGVRIEYLEQEMKQMPDAFEADLSYDHGQAASEENKPAQKLLFDNLLEHLLTIIYALKDKKTAEYAILPAILEDKKELSGTLVSRDMLNVIDLFIKYGKIDQLFDDAAGDIARRIALNADLTPYENPDKEILFCSNRIEKELIDYKLSVLGGKLRQAETEKNSGETEKLLKEISALSARKSKLKNSYHS